MGIPDRVPIAHHRGYRTSYIGSYDDGQFFGSVTATLPVSALAATTAAASTPATAPAPAFAFAPALASAAAPGTRTGPGRRSYKRWYSVLHRFDPAGAHTGSEIWVAGSSEHERTSIKRAKSHLAARIAALPDHTFGDIAIQLFHLEVDGHIFGLVDGSDPHQGHDHAEFLPDTLGFDPPWDGAYDT